MLLDPPNLARLARQKEKTMIIRKDKSIPNGKLEEMFLRVATRELISKYFRMVDANKNAPATTMATRLVFKRFMAWADEKELGI